MVDAQKVLIVAREMFESVKDQPWRQTSIEEQRRWCNYARSALQKAKVH